MGWCEHHNGFNRHGLSHKYHRRYHFYLSTRKCKLWYLCEIFIQLSSTIKVSKENLQSFLLLSSVISVQTLGWIWNISSFKHPFICCVKRHKGLKDTKECWFMEFAHWCYIFNPKRAGLFGPISQRILPPKISETDWRNIKSVVPVNSYDPPKSIGTKKSTNIPCMTPRWRHKWRHVKNTKITKNRQNHGFSLFFSSKVAFFGNDVCQSMLTHVLTPNKPNK